MSNNEPQENEPGCSRSPVEQDWDEEGIREIMRVINKQYRNITPAEAEEMREVQQILVEYQVDDEVEEVDILEYLRPLPTLHPNFDEGRRNVSNSSVNLDEIMSSQGTQGEGDDLDSYSDGSTTPSLSVSESGSASRILKKTPSMYLPKKLPFTNGGKGAKRRLSIQEKIDVASRKPRATKRHVSKSPKRGPLKRADDDSDYEPPSEDYDDSDSDSDFEPRRKSSGNVKWSSKKRKQQSEEHIERVVDDGDIERFNARLNRYYEEMEKEAPVKGSTDDDSEDEDEKTEFVLVTDDFKVPIQVWNKLYGYQREAFKWLWKLHKNDTGGILGDEMGLGKTVQVIAFLHALEYSRVDLPQSMWIGLGPCLIVCPATVIHQWVRHFHEWAPEFRVGVLHASSSYKGRLSNMIKEIYEYRGILVTTYIGVLKYRRVLLNHSWHYVVLDEGHKIRNPTAKVTVTVKFLNTKHRLLLTGSPMQNNLMELWSLYDFTNPGLLGNRQVFEEHFATPIIQGGYVNSTPAQQVTALNLAKSVKNLISPYLLRRTKTEVNADISLPPKCGKVLFCGLSEEQKRLYQDYLCSDRMWSIMGKGKHWFRDNNTRANILAAITNLRKICNHPYLYLNESSFTPGDCDEPVEAMFDHTRLEPGHRCAGQRESLEDWTNEGRYDIQVAVRGNNRRKDASKANMEASAQQ